MSTIDLIYDAVIDDAALARLPEALAAATGARSAILLQFDGESQPTGISRFGIPDEMYARFVDLGLAEHDIWTTLPAAERRFDQAVLLDDYIDADAFRRTTFFNELYRPFGDDTARCLGVLMRRTSGGLMSVGLHRGYRQSSFGVEDCARLEGLLPHLRRLSEARGRLQAAEARAERLDAALDELPFGLAVCGPDGRLRHANARAEALLRGRDGVALDHGKLIAADPAGRDAFAEAVRAAATSTGAHGGALNARRGDEPPLRVLVVPLNSAPGGALVLLDTPEAGGAPLDEVLRGLYGLTPSEAALAGLLAAGLSPAEAAAARKVRLSTVRSQIIALMRKTDSRGLGDLIRTLARTPRLGRDS